MKIKGLRDEDFVNYKDPSMFISANSCSFKCEHESGIACCQNGSLARAETVDVDIRDIIDRYIKNPITHAIVFGGLEPFDQYEDIFDFILLIRSEYKCDDPVVIYTGYTEDEVDGYVRMLSMFSNVIVKFGRYIPGIIPHEDPLLGVMLAGDNQYAKKIG